MTIKHGFQLIKEQYIKEYNTHATLLRHIKTGAELLSLSNNDENKVFGISFRTPPADSTGIAHILEHSVLCGSRKYPLKEPFVELLKGSLNTFLNAFTYPDKTCYPVASKNTQDFYNLIDVYLDAVFYPRLTQSIFQQEGWHYELENEESPLSFKGVVFNEMKGAYSSPDNVLSEKSIQSLFPDNSYGFDSGGDPKKIPDLTYEEFMEFHKKYYHPSNARIWFYGNDDQDERLKLTDEYLKEFDSINVDSIVQLQPSFQKPKSCVYPFAAGKDDPSMNKGMITLNWLLPETADVKRNLSFHLLEYILLGMPASPLRKTLIESGLGEDLAGEGLGSELRQIYFSTGLKGIRIENAEKIESLILNTMSRLTREGIDPFTIEAALNTIEFRLRENNSASFPQGLMLMLRSLTTWLYNGDPLSLLSFEKPVEKIKQQINSNKSFFEEMISRYFLANQHRTTILFKPDPYLREKEEKSEKDLLISIKSTMTQDDINHTIKNTLELKRLQETPDPPQALSTIPSLRLADLERKNQKFPLTLIEDRNSKILFHDLFTNGIVYMDIGFDLQCLPETHIPYIPLFGRALVEMGTDKEDFVQLTQRISRKTGGIHPLSFTSAVRNSRRGAQFLFLRGKAMQSQACELTSILKDILLGIQLDNRERFRQMVMEEKARMEKRIVPQGHQIVNLRLRSHFGDAYWVAEQINGISYLFFLRKLTNLVEEKWPEVLTVLRQIHKTLINKNTSVFNITLDEKGFNNFQPDLNELISALPLFPAEKPDWHYKNPVISEAMTMPSQINFVGKGADLSRFNYQFHGSTLVITRYLRNAWLWDRIRVQGGAYGAFCLFDRLTNVLTFVSYRDPNLEKTLNSFDLSAQFLRKSDFSDDEIEKSIIGAIGDIDAHLLPDAKGYTSMIHYLTGNTEEIRQQTRDEVLSTTSSHFRAFADELDHVRKNGVVKILGSAGAIEELSRKNPGWINVIEVL